MRWLRIVAVAAAVAGLVACDKDKNVDPPAELVDLRPSLAVKELWSAGVGGGGEKLGLALGLAVQDEVLYAAARDGEVRALDAASGRAQWKTRTKLELSAGPAAGSGVVVVGTNGGQVVALDAASGAQRWQAQLTGEVLATPLVAGDRVVVRTVDGRLRALSVSDGKELWTVEDLVPRLTLRGTAPPVLAGDAVIAGFDSGRLMSVALAGGEILWQAQVSSPRGRTELERLSDVDAAVQVSGDDVYAVGYQGRVAMIARETGQIWWARDLSSYRRLDIDVDQIYVATSDGNVVALRRGDGSVAWQQQGLKRRGLSGLAVQGATVIVGDFDGYVHWLHRDDGRFVARERPSRTRVSVAPLVVGDRVFVVDDGGKITAFRSGDAAGR